MQRSVGGKAKKQTKRNRWTAAKGYIQACFWEGNGINSCPELSVSWRKSHNRNRTRLILLVGAQETFQELTERENTQQFADIHLSQRQM